MKLLGRDRSSRKLAANNILLKVINKLAVTSRFASFRFILLATLFTCKQALADIDFGGKTRFIFDGQFRQLDIPLINDGEDARLIQATLEWGEDGKTEDVPMALSRPLLLVPKGERKNLAIYYQGAGLPTDRESFFLLSLLDVPQRTVKDNAMQIALRHRLKLFFRPALEGSVLEAGDRLRWKAGGTGRAVTRNDSPYYLTLTGLTLSDAAGKACGERLEHLMVAPFSSHEARVESCTAPTAGAAYSLIDDAGQEHPRAVGLQVN